MKATVANVRFMLIPPSPEFTGLDSFRASYASSALDKINLQPKPGRSESPDKHVDYGGGGKVIFKWHQHRGEDSTARQA